MTENDGPSAEQTTEQFLARLRSIFDQLSQDGLVIAVDRRTLALAREAFFAARNSQVDVASRNRGKGDTDDRVLARDEWVPQVRATNALGTLLRLFDDQIPGGIPETESTTSVDRSRLEQLEATLEETRSLRYGVYSRTIMARGPHEVADEELLAFERVVQAANELLGREGPNR